MRHDGPDRRSIAFQNLKDFLSDGHSMNISDSCAWSSCGGTTSRVQANRACATDNRSFGWLAVDGDDVAYDCGHKKVSWLNRRREAGKRGKFGWIRDVALVLDVVVDVNREDYRRRLSAGGMDV